MNSLLEELFNLLGIGLLLCGLWVIATILRPPLLKIDKLIAKWVFGEND